VHGHEKIVFQGDPLVDFSKSFSRDGGPKWWNLFFYTRNYENSLFCWNFQICGPLPTPMLMCRRKFMPRHWNMSVISSVLTSSKNSEILLILIRKMSLFDRSISIVFLFFHWQHQIAYFVSALATQLASLQTTCLLLHILCRVFAFRYLMPL